MDNDVEIIIPPEGHRPFMLSHKSKPTFEWQLCRMIPEGQIREYDSDRIGYKFWEISRPWLSRVSQLAKESFGAYRYSVSRGRAEPVNPKDVPGQLNLFRF
jgi:hypothetical protein